MLKKLLSFFGYQFKDYTFTSPAFGVINGIRSWRVTGASLVAKTKGGKVVIFPLSGTPFIEISGGGVKRVIKVDSVSTEGSY